MGKPESELKRRITQSIVMLLTVMAITTTGFGVKALAGEGDDSNVTLSQSELDEPVPVVDHNVKYGLIAAALAFGLGAIGAGIAIAHVGAAAMGAVAEKPQIAGQALIFVALAEGLVVFGFITALMILGKV